MKTFGIRLVYGKSLKKILKESNANGGRYRLEDFFYRFFTDKERAFVKQVYMTTYKNNKGKHYITFTYNLPQPGGFLYNSIESIIGAKTGYNTEVVGCEKCYIIG